MMFMLDYEKRNKLSFYFYEEVVQSFRACMWLVVRISAVVHLRVNRLKSSDSSTAKRLA